MINVEWVVHNASRSSVLLSMFLINNTDTTRYALFEEIHPERTTASPLIVQASDRTQLAQSRLRDIRAMRTFNPDRWCKLPPGGVRVAVFDQFPLSVEFQQISSLPVGSALLVSLRQCFSEEEEDDDENDDQEEVRMIMCLDEGKFERGVLGEDLVVLGQREGVPLRGGLTTVVLTE